MDPDMIPTFCITVVTHMALVNGHWQVSGFEIFFCELFWLLINFLNQLINSLEDDTVLQNFEVLNVLALRWFRMAKIHQSLENRFIQVPGRKGRKEKVILQSMAFKRFRDYKKLRKQARLQADYLC